MKKLSVRILLLAVLLAGIILAGTLVGSAEPNPDPAPASWGWYARVYKVSNAAPTGTVTAGKAAPLKATLVNTTRSAISDPGVGFYVGTKEVSWASAPGTVIAPGASLTLATNTAPNHSAAQWVPSSAGSVTIQARPGSRGVDSFTGALNFTVKVVAPVTQPPVTTVPPPTTVPPTTVPPTTVPPTTVPPTTVPPPPPTQPPAVTGRYFSNSSPWNTTLGSQNWVDVPGIHGSGYINYDTYSVPVFKGTANDPLLNVSVPASWGWPASTLQLRVPAAATQSGGSDGEITIINGTTAYDLYQFHKTDATNASATAWAKSDIVTGTGWGTLNPFLAAGVRGGGSAAIGGLLVGNELTSGINHAIGFALTFTPPCPGSFVAPAINGDGSCEGKRFGIPAGTPKPAGLSVQGSNFWNALQTYGAYSFDWAGGGTGVVLQADPNSVPLSDVNALQGDLGKILAYVKAVA